METSRIKGQNDDKYQIKEKLGSNDSTNIFLVSDKVTRNEYTANVFKKEKNNLYEQQKEILRILKENNNPYILNIIDYGEGEIIRKKGNTIKTGYYISENAPKGNLFDYIYYKKSGFGELYSKLIFSKIIKAVEFFHSKNICLRNIKLENILLDNNFSSKISNFGFTCINAPNLTDDLGTFITKSPEIYEGKPYDGIKADIFALGALLFTLTVGSLPFKSATNKDKFYKKIKNRELDKYWKIVNGTNLSNDFKDLYTKMVSYDPNQRPSTEDILNHNWFKEINEMNLEQKDILENEIKETFLNLSKIIKEKSQKEMEAIEILIDSRPYNTRSYDDDYDKFFHYDSKPKDLNTPMNMNNTIKIKGYIDPCYFMNSLCQYMINHFGIDNCFLEADEEKYKIILTCEEEGNNGEMNEDEEYSETTLEIKLYKYSDGHLLRFIQKDENRFSFLDKFEIISKLVKDLIY